MNKLTVVLDLHQTLVYTIKCKAQQHSNNQHQTTLKTTTSTILPSSSFIIMIDNEQYCVYKRPGLDKFLLLASQAFNLVCFTSSRYEHANAILDVLDSTKTIFQQRLFRQHCVPSPWFPGTFAKDLTILNTPMNRVVLVDDSYDSFFQVYNAGTLLFSTIQSMLRKNFILMTNFYYVNIYLLCFFY
jgi:Dullard-like phosphatase family protein